MTGPRPPGRQNGCIVWSSAGRPRPGERESGDLAVHVELEDGGAVVAVVDGLGHGPEAAAAAAGARNVVEAAAAGAPLDEVLRRVHEALARTRGVVMTIASIGCSGLMRWVGVGNVEAHVVRGDGESVRRAASAVLYGGVLGYRLPDVKVTTVELEPGDLVLMATDGIDPDFADMVSPADTVEQLTARLVERCARPHDDALVAAARYQGRSS